MLTSVVSAQRSASRWVIVVLTAIVATGVVALPASALEFQGFGGTASSGATRAPVRQAGAHPDLRVQFTLPRKVPGDLLSPPLELPHQLRVDMPVGIVGNPSATVQCRESALKAEGNGTRANCPVGSQVGAAHIMRSLGNWGGTDAPVFNMEPPRGSPAMFAFNFLGVVVKLIPEVRAGDYGITIDTGDISTAEIVLGADVELWGVPADPSHDPWRVQIGKALNCVGDPYVGNCSGAGASSQSPRVPLLTLPTSCPGTPAVTTGHIDGWDRIGSFGSASFTEDLNGVPFVTTGCERLAFEPAVDVRVTSRKTDAPTGLDVDLRVPQSDAPDGLATAHVRDVAVVLPLGMSVSPSSAAGLGACSPDQIGLGSEGSPRCPVSSKIGTVTVETPLLSEPLTGDVILATPDRNPFGSLLALYIVAEGSGVRVKLPGRVDANAVTGQLTATFANNPQLPFSALKVRIDGGANAPLATPTACGRYETSIDISSWSGKTASLSSPMVLDEGCAPRGFAPTVSAGSNLPLAGKDSPFTMTIDRPDGQQNLAKVQTVLPPGLLARIGNVDLCPEAQAASGACGAGSLVGSTQVLAGPGSAPLPVRGNVYLTGPYGGAPYGLSIVVPTAGQAGPFDLGNVVVRAKISVDRNDAHVTVASDPLPTIIRGFPLRIRKVVVSVDRPGFTFNPTGCKASRVDVATASTAGVTSVSTPPYRLGGCGDLELDQKITMGFTNKTQTKVGKHPGVRAKMTSKAQGTNLRAVAVKLPLSVALDPDNAKALCKPEERAALKCPAASIVGKATAVSVLKQPLKGPIYFVEGTRKSKTGRIIKTLPKLWIPLSGGGITVDVNADSTVDKQQRLVSTFSDLPDAPISSFDLRIGGGKNGILKVPPSKEGGTCTRDRTVYMQLTGQNGKKLERAVKASVDGCKKASKKKAKKASASKRSASADSKARR